MKNVSFDEKVTFFEALENASKKDGSSVLAYNSIVERYTMYSYILSRAKVIKIYSFDLSLFSETSRNKLNQEMKSDSTNFFSYFHNAFNNFFAKENCSIEILLDKENLNFIESISPDIQDKFQYELSLSKITIKKIRDDLNLVKGMNHFIIAQDLRIVCFDQESDELRICSINDNNISNKSQKVFDNLFDVSVSIPVESNICDK